jgi:hypothetical protein
MTTQSSADRRPAAPGSLFNEFLTRAVRNGSLSAEHRRVRSRQPENEVFVRKALVTMGRLAPTVVVRASFVELTAGQPRHGRASLAEAAAQRLRSTAGLGRFIGAPSAAAGEPLPPMELFALLQAYAHLEVAKTAAPVFGVGAATIGAGLSGQEDKVKPRIRDAADSVFAQSFADAHALTLMAAFDGNQSALTALNEVLARRQAGGDFGAFSLAPLSQDSSSALELLRHELGRGKDFGSMGHDELWGHSMWVATEGLGAWMQKHGASARAAASVTQAVESASHVLAVASAKLAPQTKAARRPN